MAIMFRRFAGTGFFGVFFRVMACLLAAVEAARAAFAVGWRGRFTPRPREEAC